MLCTFGLNSASAHEVRGTGQEPGRSFGERVDNEGEFSR